MEEDLNDRKSKLGFKPQKENVYNQLLPYADKIDDEALDLLKKVKSNLVKTVLAREMRPGFALWSALLNQYIKLYGLMFSKEDHISLIKLYFDILTLDNQEPTRIVRCASTLVLLLKKRYILSRDDLVLDWKPLYKLSKTIKDNTKSDVGMYRYPAALETSIANVIRLSRIYFPASATQEILDEFSWNLCPLNVVEMTSAVEYLEAFLPICVKFEEAPVSYDLWFDEFMQTWNSCPNDNSWENAMTWLMARLSANNIGFVDWNPYIHIMYARFTRSLQLPVHFKQRLSSKTHKVDVNAMSLWIVSTLNNKTDRSFYHLEKFMQMITSYLYSANIGRWSAKLKELLNKLSYYFVNRIYIERYRVNSWEKEVPDDYKLDDASIDRFVIILRPCLEQAMFTRRAFGEITSTFQNLASLRPHLIVPMTLDKLYASLDSLTEPNKLISAMAAVVSVARQMVQGAKYNYPEGPTHIIPLLLAVLPGIDPNDFRKCFTTFHFITQFVCMIPIVNSSDACNHYDDLTEEEHMICEATAGFEDFVLQFIDRICTWVESSSLDFIRPEQQTRELNVRDGFEFMSEHAMTSVITIVLRQCSPEIFTAALKKVFNFVTNNVLEVDVSGKLLAVLCGCFAKVNPKESLKVFIPHFCDRIETLLSENVSAQDEEHLDGEFLYTLLILSEVVDGRSDVIQYIDRLIPILDKTLHMTSVAANKISGHMLTLLMLSLSTIHPTEYRSSEQSYSMPTKDFLPIREWGFALKAEDLKVSWYIPGKEEIDTIQRLVNKYLLPELERLDKYSAGQITLNRFELRRTLKIITAVLASYTVFPMWDEPVIELKESVSFANYFRIHEGVEHKVTMPDGRNIRKVIADTLHRTQAKLVLLDEGDTKSTFAIINIYNTLLFNKTKLFDIEQNWKSFVALKKVLTNRLLDRKHHLRHLLIDRVTLQQLFRIESAHFPFSATHKQILFDLFQLGISPYSDVRIYSQSKLVPIISNFPYSYTLLLPKLRELLQTNTEENHEQFKGCLYILINSKKTSMITKHDWKFISEIWPLIVNSMPSEKPSIINLIAKVSECVLTNFPTITIDFVIPDRILCAALDLSETEPACESADFKQIAENSADVLKEECRQRKEDYNKLVDALLEACLNSNLHWRYNLLAVGFLRDVVHADVKFNASIIRYFLRALINDSILIRKVALRMVVYILIQNKPKFKKVPMDKATFSNVRNHRRPGLREDNKWLLYNSETIPKNAIEWDQPRYVHDASVGYYAWPKSVKVHAAPCDQPSVVNDLDKMTTEQREIYNFFIDKDNVNQLIHYLSMEEKKGKDQFSVTKALIFKYLFKILEDQTFNVFLPHIERLAVETQESSQRCAAEIICGLIRGSKHWSYDKVENMWTKIIPILQTANQNILTETVSDWTISYCMALQSRDPSRHHWILESLLQDPLADPTSFIASSKIHLLNNAINQQSWRNAEIFNRHLDYLKQHLSHPFQNIRNKISGSLKIIFTKDFESPLGHTTNCPKIADFFAEIMPTLDQLYKETLKKVDNGRNHVLDEACDGLQAVSLTGETDKENRMRLFKIIGKFVTSTLLCRMSLVTSLEFYKILPLTCVLQSNDTDDEVKGICTNLLALLSQSLVMEKNVPAIFDIIKDLAKCPLWSARSTLTEFLSSFTFHNMAIILSNPEWVLEVQTMVLNLLEDSQPEVRINAGKVLSGLLHCQFLPAPTELLTHFKSKAKTKVKPSTKTTTGIVTSSGINSNLRLRHAGVLGLCAFISSTPYDVPDYLPDIFGQLGPHLSDPQPIPSTIRKTLGDFKRTHQDNWEVHKMKFTEDELSVLRDLTVPPSYYV